MVEKVDRTPGGLLRRIVDSMTMPQLKDYAVYMQSDGFMVRNVTDIDAGAILHSRGFLIAAPDFINPQPVYLTRSAWDRFQIAEWTEIQRLIDIETSGPEFGSW